MRAPRARAASPRSSTRAAAPSPRTKPSRPLSNGREARSGSSLRVDIARIAAKPAIGSGCTHASAPPTSTTSARSKRSRSRPQRMASAPEAQALTGACTPPLAPIGEPDRGGGAVGHEHRDGEGGDPLGALLLQDVVLAEQGQRPADAGAEDDGDALGVDPGVARRRSRRHASLGGDDRDLLAAVEAAGPDPVDLLGRVVGEPGDELGGELLDPVVGDAGDPRPPGQQRVPGAGHVATERRGGAEAGDDDVVVVLMTAPPGTCGRAAG